jgi:hypothetical protein
MTVPSASALATDSMAAMNPPARTIATASAPPMAVTSGAICSLRGTVATDTPASRELASGAAR